MLKSLINLGVNENTGFDSRKRVRFTNIITCLSLLMILSLLLLFSSWGVNPSISLGLLGLFVLVSIPLVLNFFEYTILSRLWFLFQAYIILVILPFTFGEESGFHLYMISGFGMPLLFFRDEIKWQKWLLACLIFPCYGLVVWHFKMFPDKELILDIPIENLRIFNEIMVLLTVATMFGAFIRENEIHFKMLSEQRNQLLAFEYARSASIRYAESIQKSILPPTQLMNNMLPGHILFNQPKDIVSGDFYWAKERQEKRYVAVVDCTGHGVPGSLLSMMVNSLLDSILVEVEKPSPATVLRLLHKKIYNTLHQDSVTENTMDGCDIGLITVDPLYETVSFAGANTDLYLVRNNKLTTFKGGRESVGGYGNGGRPTETREFKEQNIELKAGDLVVLSTDGLIDQLNPQMQTFGDHEFEEVLIRMSSSEIQSKSSYVNEAIRKWKQTNDQIDDYLLIGIQTPD